MGKFGNNAATVTKKIQITDTIPPTPYITKKDARATKNLQGDDCHRTHSAKWSAGNKGDYTNAECEFEHDDKHETFTHKSLMTDKNSHVVGESVHRDDPMATEMVIQHSAGYAEDYKFVEELMQGRMLQDHHHRGLEEVLLQRRRRLRIQHAQARHLLPQVHLHRRPAPDHRLPYLHQR